MFKKYKDFIQQYIPLNSKEWDLFQTYLAIKNFKKGDIILHQGDECKELYFINSGLARAYIIDENGKDFTWNIFFNDENAKMTNLFVTEYNSFLHQCPSMLHIEALNDCELVAISYKNLQLSYNKFPSAERFGRLMAESAYSYLHNKIIKREVTTAKERFENFIKETPYLLDKVPQYHIATLLGITPQHLSRLKKKYKN